MIGYLLGRRWRDRGRLLFHFHDGRRQRSIDPMLAWSALESHASYRHSRDFASAMAGDEQKQLAAVDAACEAFDIAEYSDEDGCGMTVTERLALLYQFDHYATQLRTGLGLAAIGRNTPPATLDDSTAPGSRSSEPPQQQAENAS